MTTTYEWPEDNDWNDNDNEWLDIWYDYEWPDEDYSFYESSEYQGWVRSLEEDNAE